MANRKQLENCDVYLMIPGRINKSANISNYNETNPIIESFISNITEVVKSEFDGDFFKAVSRYYLGPAKIVIDDVYDNQRYDQPAQMVLTVHDETRLAILEIITPSVEIGGNKLLSYYCGKDINFEIADQKFSYDELLENYGIKPFGIKRSIVFANNDVQDFEIINALANEEFPMGTIGGALGQKLKTENHAQYDTAEVYVSLATMFEKCKNWPAEPLDRIPYQTIEVFFVELLLFQDAAIDKMYHDIQEEKDKQRNGIDLAGARQRFEKLSFNMSQALKFTDYNQFLYPTVKISATTVSKAFGIDLIYDKYENNKKLLQEMIEINERRMRKESDDVKSRFLFILTALSAFSAINGALTNVFGSAIKSYSYFIAAGAVTVTYIIYRLIIKEKKKKYK